MNTVLEKKLKELPISPGVYFHKNQSGEIIYIGKAAVLKNRVRQYFQSKKDFDVKTLALVNDIYDTDWIETDSEIDALFLESEMVKRYMPRYNILLRDDKSQLFVRIDMKSEWPHVSYTHEPLDDAANYYGPYYSGYAVKKALRYLRKIFPYYTKPPVDRRRDLDTHLGLSPRHDTTSQEYKKSLKKLIQYIEGNKQTIIKELEREMNRAAKAEEFELAAQYRNKLTYLSELRRRIMFGDKEFLDISKDKALAHLRDLLGFSVPPRRIEGFDISHMGGKNVVASMVVFTNGASDRAQYRKFKMTNQTNDDYAQMHEVIARRFSQKNIKAWGMPDLVLIDGGKGQLGAAIMALESVGVSVPVISIAKRDEEIVIHKEKSHVDTSKFTALMMDGESGVYITESNHHFIVNLHAGQLNAGSHSRNLRGGDVVSKYTDVTKLFQRIRDESHRFAVSYHTVLKKSGQTNSALDDIPGVGLATKRKLIRKFGSIAGVKQSTVSVIAEVVGESKANIIAKYLGMNT